jgi:ABC-type multidrug transport system fused ATPase/permease subunit
LGKIAGDVGDAKVREYADALGAMDWADSCADALETRIGRSGRQLSHGQIQKLVALRSVLKEPSLLLLDEVSSGIDLDSERKLFEGINRLKSQSALAIMVTHHITTTIEPWIDRVIVLVDGKVIEDGSPRCLATREGLYARWLTMGAIASPPQPIETNCAVNSGTSTPCRNVDRLA